MAAGGQTLKFLYDLQKTGIKTGLDNVRYLLSGLGNPHNDYPVIHVAGTNGKGSTASMIAAALSAAGYRTGLYTSPHLIDFRERIRVNGRKIGPAALSAIAEMIRTAVGKTGATFFDATTAIAFRYFADRGVDVAVIETGLGGRLDSTNVVTPVVSVITSIGIEHREYLGDTLPQIAFEKAGIIKKRIPLVAGEIPGPAWKVISGKARDLSSTVYRAGKHTECLGEEMTIGRVIADLRVLGREYRGLEIVPTGLHQVRNARTALLTIEVLRRSGLFRVTVPSVRKGFSGLRRYTGLSGRLQVLRKNPPVVVDVAHNPDGVRSLVASAVRLGLQRATVVFGVLEDKDHASMINLLGQLAGKFVFVPPASERGRNPGDLLEISRRLRIPAFSAVSVRKGVELAITETTPGRWILITGSHYVAGEALQYFEADV